jgi:hypothetical protein
MLIIIIIIIEEASRRIPHMVISADAQADDANDTMIWSPAQGTRLARSRWTSPCFGCRSFAPACMNHSLMSCRNGRGMSKSPGNCRSSSPCRQLQDIFVLGATDTGVEYTF